MPYGPEDAYKYNSKIKSDRHARMWSDVFNSVLKKHGDEGRAFREANSVVDIDIGRSKVGGGDKQTRMTQDQALHDTRVDADKVNIPYGQLPGDEQNYQDYKAQQTRQPESSARPGEPFNTERPYTAAPGDPENTIPAGRTPDKVQMPHQMPPPPPVPTPVETIGERFPSGPESPPDFTTAIKRFDAENPQKPKGKLIRPGTQERFLDPTKTTL